MKELKEYLNELKLREFAQHLEPLLESYPDSGDDCIMILKNLCQKELSDKKQRSIAYRIEQAKFSQIQTVDTFNFQYNASTKKIKNIYLKLFSKELITDGLCALFVGSAGLGKTHLSRALGYYFCQESIRVRFTTLSAMTIELINADATQNLKKIIMSYTQPTLLILDEIGYVSLRELESNLIFQVISQRYDAKRSTVITTNRPFGEWNQIFHNDAMARALIDRLIERSEVFHLEGKSYRETHRQRLKK